MALMQKQCQEIPSSIERVSVGIIMNSERWRLPTIPFNYILYNCSKPELCQKQAEPRQSRREGNSSFERRHTQHHKDVAASAGRAAKDACMTTSKKRDLRTKDPFDLLNSDMTQCLPAHYLGRQ